MPKKTASPTRRHPKVSGNQDSGLIAKGYQPRQAGWEKSALDHRSHRTSQRLSCDAGLVRVSHAPDGSILDVGRRTRTIPPALRRALEVRDRGCRFPGCGLRFTDGHHVRHWAQGGETKLENLLLMCRLSRIRDKRHYPDSRIIPT